MFAKCPDCHGTGRVGGLTDPRSRRAVEVAERYADLPNAEDYERERRIVQGAAFQVPGSELPGAVMLAAECLGSRLAERLHNLLQIVDFRATLPTIAALLREIVGNPFRPVTLPGTPMTCDVKFGGVTCGGAYQMLRKDWGLLSRCGRCGAEGPFWVQVVKGSTCPWLTWNDCTVPKLARAIYDGRRWDELPILADALEESGCTDEAILRHLRGEERCPAHPTSDLRKYKGDWVTSPEGFKGPKGPIMCDRCGSMGDQDGWIPLRAPHALGCWVLDLLLGQV